MGAMTRARWWWVAAAAVLVVAVGVTPWTTLGQQSATPCAPVRDLLAFNTSQTDAMRAKIHLPAQGSAEEATGPDDTDYRTWADGIAQRAAEVTDQTLAPTAQQAADLSSRIADKRREAVAQVDAMAATDTEPPPAARDAALAQQQYAMAITRLDQACPA